MPKSPPRSNLHDVVSSLADRLAAAFAVAVEQQVTERLRTMKPGRALAGSARRQAAAGGGRICPVAGCGEPGAGPRNRWFCREHAAKLSVTEQKRLLQLAKSAAAALPAGRGRGKQRPAVSLDMACRVEGCSNRSRGPRFGYICDEHRARLSEAQQQEAREAYRLRQKR
jgi:hypothetical protein